MKSKLPASHLFRQFLLFALTLVFLLTVIRAAYALWQFSRIEVADTVTEMTKIKHAFDSGIMAAQGVEF